MNVFNYWTACFQKGEQWSFPHCLPGSRDCARIFITIPPGRYYYFHLPGEETQRSSVNNSMIKKKKLPVKQVYDTTSLQL